MKVLKVVWVISASMSSFLLSKEGSGHLAELISVPATVLLIGTKADQKVLMPRLGTGAEVLLLPEIEETIVDSAMSSSHANSYRVMRWLEKNADIFGTVCFYDRDGLAYYSCLLKAAGLSLEAISICVRITEPTCYALEKRRGLAKSLAVLEADFMERESMRLADVVVCHSEDVQNWMQLNGWLLPALVVNNLQDALADPSFPPKRHQISDAPLVSIVLGHFNRVPLLKQALQSIKEQTYPAVEVVLVDGGSTQPAVFDYLKECETEFHNRNWRIVYDTNRYIGAARNLGAENARGTLLFFMDDDNYLMPEAIETFVKVAKATRADIVASANKRFASMEAPQPSRDGSNIWVPLGGAIARGAFGNVFGDASFLISRSLFKSLGGFTEDFGVGGEDAEFLADAVLRGASLFPIPRPLYWYRINPVSMSTSTGGSQSESMRQRCLRPYVAAFGREAGLIISYTTGGLATPSYGSMVRWIVRRLCLDLLNKNQWFRTFYYRVRSWNFMRRLVEKAKS